MATKFLFGKGSVFTISIDNGTTYFPVSQSKNYQFGGSKSDMEDITNMDSVGAFREWAPTLRDSGNLTFNSVFDPMDAGQVALHGAFLNATLLLCKLQAPKSSDQTTAGMLRTFTAYVTDHNIDYQTDKTSTLAVTLKITGPVTDVYGS